VYVASLRQRGVEIEQGGPELAARRQVERLFVTKGPSSVAHEFYVCARIAIEPFSSPALKGPGFVTGALGFGHLLLRADDLPRSIAYCSEILGLRLSDRILEEVAPGIVVDATFFHTKTGRHHSMAVAVMPGTRRIGHLMVEVQSMDDVGLAFERCVAAGHPIRATLGKHPNDQMFSFYVETPSGFSLEYGWGGIVIDQPDWDARTYDRLSVWGHKRQATLGQRTA
jgi:2,3-dihydroxybiphenyl 1,2-dioxygenase